MIIFLWLYLITAILFGVYSAKLANSKSVFKGIAIILVNALLCPIILLIAVAKPNL